MLEAQTQAQSTSVTDEMENMYLTFTVGNEVYGIEIRHVIQIVGMQEINEMPEMSACMKGFINLRGSVIPVVSMRLRFGNIEDEYTDRTCIIVVVVGEKEIGLIVDAIQETITIEPESISSPPDTGEGKSIPYIRGIAQLQNNGVSVLIDVQKLFVHEEY